MTACLHWFRSGVRLSGSGFRIRWRVGVRAGSGLRIRSRVRAWVGYVGAGSYMLSPETSRCMGVSW